MTIFASPLLSHEPTHFVGTDRKALYQQVEAWLAARDVPKVAVTLVARPARQCEGRRVALSAEEFSLAVRLLITKLSRRCFTAREVEKRSKRLKSAFVSETGLQRGLHFHGWIEVPNGVNHDEYAKQVCETWQTLQLGDYAHVDSQCDAGWLHYMLKTKTTGEAFDHIDLRNVSLD
jgi:hypothetical protein